MASPSDLAQRHYVQRLRYVTAAARLAAEQWAQVDPTAISSSWLKQLPGLLAVVSGAQLAAAQAAEPYTAAALAAQSLPAAAEAALAAVALAGIASDGRDLASLLYQPAIKALTSIGTGAPVGRALAAGAMSLDTIVRTQVSDAGRVADQVALVTQPAATGYVRMTVGTSCSRCIVLAGQWYEWNAGFDRHPADDCVHIPSSENTGEDLRTDPMATFNAMTTTEQDQVFTGAGAQAIRDGADINQVVNARRGANGLTPAGNAKLTDAEKQMLRGGRDRGRLIATRFGGRDVFTTTEGTTRRGLAGQRLAQLPGAKAAKVPRLMPESIYEIAGDDRELALELLRRFGYIL